MSQRDGNTSAVELDSETSFYVFLIAVKHLVGNVTDLAMKQTQTGIVN